MSTPSSPNFRPLQRGVALITAMVVVVAASLVVAENATRQLVDIRRTDHLLTAERVQLLAQGVESWARGMLVKDLENGAVDHLGEDWAKPLPATVVEGVTLAGSLEDLQGRFNLNGLLQANGEPDPLQVTRLQRLLRALELEPELVQGVLDWLDGDLDPRFPGGAEDDHYLRLEPPYRAANRPLASVTELRLVTGFDAATYARLIPFVTALPEATPVNVNTASPEVLRTLAEGLTAMDVEGLMRSRDQTPFASVEQVLQHDAFAGRQVVAQGLAVNSAHFLVRAWVERSGHGRTMAAALVRDTTVSVRLRNLQGDTL